MFLRGDSVILGTSTCYTLVRPLIPLQFYGTLRKTANGVLYVHSGLTCTFMHSWLVVDTLASACAVENNPVVCRVAERVNVEAQIETAVERNGVFGHEPPCLFSTIPSSLPFISHLNLYSKSLVQPVSHRHRNLPPARVDA